MRQQSKDKLVGFLAALALVCGVLVVYKARYRVGHRLKAWISHPVSSQAEAAPAKEAPSATTSLSNASILTDSGTVAPLALITDAMDPAEPNLTKPLRVSVPSAQCPRMIGLVSPAIAIPTSSRIRRVEASWNGTPLPLIIPKGEISEEPHGYGNPYPFFKPLFSLADVPAGTGTLRISASDGKKAALTTVEISGLTVVKPPAPLTAAQVASQAHPRIYLTPARLAQIRAKPANDRTVQRYWSETEGVRYFLNAYTPGVDLYSKAFESKVYDVEGYIPALALCYQLKKGSDVATAGKCADAAKRMALRILKDYETGARTFDRDHGYPIRFDLRNLMLALDWMYDLFTPAERVAMASLATKWVGWYPTGGYAATQPVENYYAGYLQGLALAAITTAGDNPEADRLLGVLRAELTDKVPVLNQRACGGDWPEGWNYGPYTLIEFALVNQALKDVGEDWSADFDFVQPVARTLTYQVTSDLKHTVSFGDYSGDAHHFMRASLLAVLSSTTTDGALARRLYNAMFAVTDSDIHGMDRGSTFYEMAFGNLSPPALLAPMPLSYLNAGSGRYFSKSSFTEPTGTTVTVENIPYMGDHYGAANGDVQFFRGSTCLLCSAAYRGERFIGLGTTKDYSTYLVDGKGAAVSRNGQMLFHTEYGTWSALGMRFESSFPVSRYDEGMMSPTMPLDYLIREVVHLRPGILVVRDLHRRRRAEVSLVANWHLGPMGPLQTLGEGRYKIGTLQISTFLPKETKSDFAPDADQNGKPFGIRLTQTFPASADRLETVTVFSETATATSYADGVLKLSNGQTVTFANGGVSVSK